MAGVMKVGSLDGNMEMKLDADVPPWVNTKSENHIMDDLGALINYMGLIAPIAMPLGDM